MATSARGLGDLLPQCVHMGQFQHRMAQRFDPRRVVGGAKIGVRRYHGAMLGAVGIDDFVVFHRPSRTYGGLCLMFQKDAEILVPGVGFQKFNQFGHGFLWPFEQLNKRGSVGDQDTGHAQFGIVAACH